MTDAVSADGARATRRPEPIDCELDAVAGAGRGDGIRPDGLVSVRGSAANVNVLAGKTAAAAGGVERDHRMSVVLSSRGKAFSCRQSQV